MNIALSQLIEALRRSLADEVGPELSTDHARGQLAAVQDILGKIERMAVWSPDAATQQVSVLAQGCAAFVDRLKQAGIELESFEPSADADLHAVEARVLQLTDWLFDAGSTLPRPLRDDLDAILRQAMRQQLLVQRKLIPLTDFGAMTSAARP